MKTARCVLLAAAWAFLGWSGCGTATTSSSGETHFLMGCVGGCEEGFECLCGVCTLACDDDAACSGVAPRASCVEAAADVCGGEASVCDQQCESDTDCSDLGSSFRCVGDVCRSGQVEAPSITCPDGCSVLFGFPEDPRNACVQLDAVVEGAPEPGVPLACSCDGETATDYSCYERSSDGSLWLLPSRELSDPDAFTPCSAEQAERVAVSCDFAHCPIDRRPPSSCNFQSTCEFYQCDNPWIDAGGCQREPCTSDTDCQSGAHCTAFDFTQLTGFLAPGLGCTFGGAGVSTSGSFCDAEETLREVCDGSREVRLFANTDGGFVDYGWEFTHPYGHRFLVVSGQCEFWAGPTDTGGVAIGTVDDSQALEQAIGWYSLREWSDYQDNAGCSDGSAASVVAPGARATCDCGCSVEEGAPEGLGEAQMAAWDLAGDYAEAGAPYQGDVRAVVVSDAQDLGLPGEPSFDWPLALDIEQFLAPNPFSLTAESGLVVSSDDADLLRALRDEQRAAGGGEAIAIQTSDGTPYWLLMRDELPVEVRESLERLRAGER